jgi:hypothetical protein
MVTMLLVPLVLVAMSLNWLIPTERHIASAVFMLVVVGYVVWLGNKHHVLQPKCPFCHPPDDDEDEDPDLVAPTPPSAEKTKV